MGKTMPQSCGIVRLTKKSSHWVGADPKFDSCLYYLRSNTGELIGIMGVHIDDTAIAGRGPLFEESVAKLKARFSYRKWRVSSGEFCEAFYEQDKDSFFPCPCKRLPIP